MNCLWKIMFAAALLLLSAGQAHAQRRVFIEPCWGGGVAYPFNSTKAAVPGKYHTGIDYWGPGNMSTYILCSSVGVVDKVIINGKNDHGLGNCVIVRHNVVIDYHGRTAPYYTLYGHLDSIVKYVFPGKILRQGDPIGTMGSSGKGKRFYWGNSPHLHFEVKTQPVLHNPYGSGMYWGYTPKPAQNYGYIDPASVIGRWEAR